MATVPLDDFSVDSDTINRRRQMAQALMGTQMPQGRMVGRHYVAANPLEYLAAGLKQYAGRKDMEMADQDARALGEQKRARSAEEVQGYIRALKGTPGQPEQVGNNPSAYVPEQPATPGDPNAALAMALSSRNPMLQQLGMGQIKEMTAGPKVVGRSLIDPATGKVVGVDSTWQAEQQAARDARAAELQARLDDQRLARQERADLQRELASLRASTAGGAGAGKPPPGYRFTPEGNLQAIPGGPADQKLAGQLNADTMGLQGATSNFDRLAQAANALKNSPGLEGITGLRGKLPNMPGSDAANARAQLDTLKSQIAFGVLQDMRNQSKTGGALGAVSEKELMLLQNNLAALDQAQSYEAFQKALGDIVNYTEQAKDRMRQAYNLKHGDKGGAPAGGAADDPLGLRRK
jgi:hypothetical protein